MSRIFDHTCSLHQWHDVKLSHQMNVVKRSKSGHCSHMKVKRHGSVGGGRGASLVKIPVSNGTLSTEVSVATYCKCKSNVKGVWVDGDVYRL